MQSNNIVQLSGEIVSPIDRIPGTDICRTYLASMRVSGITDVIPLDIPEYLTEDISTGSHICVTGMLASHNKSKRVQLSVLVSHVHLRNSALPDTNEIYLEGYICRQPVYRVTPRGKEITELLLAINHPFKHSNYIPCITWGPNAVKAEQYRVGDMVVANGRIQSRDYTKWTDGREETRTAYEVSISKIEVCGERIYVG